MKVTRPLRSLRPRGRRLKKPISSLMLLLDAPRAVWGEGNLVPPLAPSFSLGPLVLFVGNPCLFVQVQHSIPRMEAKGSDLVFVTVGTTRFDALIKTVTQPEALKALKRRGYKRLRLQIGAGQPPPPVANSAVRETRSNTPLEVEFYKYKDSLLPDMQEAGLIISHAGAGSVMESLALKKPLVVVVNTALMDDHQQELADALARQGHLIATTPKGLVEVLDKGDLQTLQPRPKVETTLFPQLLDEEMGFEAGKGGSKTS